MATGRYSARRTSRPVLNIPAHYTKRTRKALEQAWLVAKQRQHTELETRHLIFALTQDRASLSSQLLAQFGITAAQLEATLLVFSAPLLQGATTPTPSLRYNRIIALAAKIALRLNQPYVGTEHLLLAILEEELENPGPLQPLNLNLVELHQQIITCLQKPEYRPFAYLDKKDKSKENKKK